MISSQPSKGGSDTIPCRAAGKKPDLFFLSDWPIEFNPFFIGYFIFSLLLSVHCQVMKFTDQLNEIHILHLLWAEGNKIKICGRLYL